MAQSTDIPAAPETGRLSFSDLVGWGEDDLAAALAAFARCPDTPLARRAAKAPDARRFIEAHFRPTTPANGHFTGYFEPELPASPTPSAEYSVPLHRLPPEGCDLPRAQIDAALGDHAFVWLRDPVDRFFLQVQGSGRLRMVDGSTQRVGYAGKNGHPYTSVGRLLIDRGVFGNDITADALAAWLRADPARGAAVMAENASYVFFAPTDGAADDGPIGTLGCPVTPGRSLAVDPAHCPLGSLVWITVDGIARLCVAQDTGSAIKGIGRADLFMGTGAEAGTRAGRLNHAGTFTILVPR